MAVGGVIESSGFSSGSFTVDRSTDNGYDNEGIYKSATASSFAIVANVQPLSGNDLKALDPALHSEELRLLFTKTAAVRTVSSLGPADTITIGSDTWEVKTVEPWAAFGGTHYEVVIARVVV